MAYLALARKYRPQRFEDIVGQEHVTRTLQKAIAGGRVHHAYLLTGIRGIGKTTAARVLAKALNCAEGPTPSPCNNCLSCTEITAGRSMDVIELDAASNRGIDDVRELREGVRYTTARDRYKVVIIDEVHMLTEAAFNALLKTLEEPPAHVRFILATTDPQKLPATILSRCQRFDFRRVTAASLVAHLAAICQAEGISVEEGALAIVVRQTQGSVRDAVSLLDQLLAGSEGQLTEQRAMEVLGVADRRWVFDTLAALLGQNAGRALEIVREVFVSGYDVNLFMQELVLAVRNAMVVRVAGGNRELVELSDSELKAFLALVDGRNPADLQHYLRVILESAERIRRSEFPLYAAEEALARVASAGQTVSVAQLLGKLERLEVRLAALGEVPQVGPPVEAGPDAEEVSEVREPPAATLFRPPPTPPRRQPDIEPPSPPKVEVVAGEPGTPLAQPGVDGSDIHPAAALAGSTTSPEAPATSEVSPPDPLETEEAPKGDKPERRYASLLHMDPGLFWRDFVAFVRADENRGLGELDSGALEACLVERLTEETIHVVYPCGALPALQALSLPERLCEFLRAPVRMELRESESGALTDSLEQQRCRKRATRRTEVKGQLAEMAGTRRALELFDGELVGVTVDEKSINSEPV